MDSQNTSNPAIAPEQSQSLTNPVNQKQNYILILLGLFIVVLLGSTGYLMYQNMQLQKEVAKMQTPVSNSPSPILSTTPDQTANWKMYSYPNYNYSFKIPSTYIVSSNTPSPKETYILQSLNLSETNASGGPNDLILSVQSQILPAVLETIGVLSNFSQSGTVIISGREWTIATHTTGTIVESQYIAQVGTMSYTVDGTNTKFIEQVISTFQFTNQTSQTDTSSWKTYTSANNIYSIQYPSSWYVNQYSGSSNFANNIEISDMLNSYSIQGDSTYIRIDVSVNANPMPTSFPYTNGSSVNNTIKPFAVNSLSGIRGYMTSTAGLTEVVYLQKS